MKLKRRAGLALILVLASHLRANAGEGREQWTPIALAGYYASGWIDGFSREGTREFLYTSRCIGRLSAQINHRVGGTRHRRLCLT